MSMTQCIQYESIEIPNNTKYEVTRILIRHEDDDDDDVCLIITMYNG